MSHLTERITAASEGPTGAEVDRSHVRISMIVADKMEALQSNGHRVSLRATPASRSPKKGPAADISSNPVTRSVILVNIPVSYQVFDGLRDRTDPALGGRPPVYPLALYSVLYSLQHAISTHLALLAYANLYNVLPTIVEMIASLMPEQPPHEAETTRRWLADPRMPSAPHFGRFLRSLPQRGFDGEQEVMRLGVTAGLQANRFSLKTSEYSITNAILGDGTVIGAASKGKDDFTIDPDTAVVTRRRPDKLAMLHTEGAPEPLSSTERKLSLCGQSNLSVTGRSHSDSLSWTHPPLLSKHTHRSISP